MEYRVIERTVCPIALTYYVDNVLLAAWCELREGLRHFRVDLMKTCRPIDSLFKGEGERLRAQWRSQRELFSAS